MPEPTSPHPPTVLKTITTSGLAHHVVDVHAVVDLEGQLSVDLDGPAEQRDRIRAALLNTAWSWPHGSIRLEREVAAGDLGASSDLAIAIAVLVATGQAVTWPELADTLILGELAPDGSVRTCRGVYPAVKAAKAAGLSRVIVPAENYAEARLVDGIAVAVAGDSLQWVNTWLAGALGVDDNGPTVEPDPLGPLLITADPESGEVTVESVSAGPHPGSPPWDRVDGIAVERISVSEADLAEIPAHVLRAVGLAAAGGHHLILTHESDAGYAGDVGALLVELLPQMAPMAREEVLDLWSLAGALDPDWSAALDWESEMVLVLPDLLLDRLHGLPDHPTRPGYMSLAHHGVLHLADAAAIHAAGLDVVAQTLTRRSIVATGRSPYDRYPAEFQLLATTAACPEFHTPCTCPPEARVLHTRHIDDILGAHAAINIAATEPADTFDPDTVPTAEHVATARIRAARRWHPASGTLHTNHSVPADTLWEATHEAFPDEVHLRIARLVANGVLAEPHIELVQRLMWTIADYDGVTAPGDAQLTEALALHLHTPKTH